MKLGAGEEEAAGEEDAGAEQGRRRRGGGGRAGGGVRQPAGKEEAAGEEESMINVQLASPVTSCLRHCSPVFNFRKITESWLLPYLYFGRSEKCK